MYWPELLAKLKQVGISDYSISRRGQDLFLVMQVTDFEGAWDTLAQDPVNLRWQAEMAKYFEPVPGLQSGERFAMMHDERGVLHGIEAEAWGDSGWILPRREAPLTIEPVSPALKRSAGETITYHGNVTAVLSHRIVQYGGDRLFWTGHGSPQGAGVAPGKTFRSAL